MAVFDRVRERANESRWSVSPYRGFIGERPSNTYNEIVSMAFDDVTQSYHHAKHSRYEEMYSPLLGTFRELPYYTSLAPSLCIPRRNRTCTYLYTPHNSYHPRQGEWLTEQGRQRHVNTPKKTGGLRSWSEPPLPPTYRRTYTVPTSTTRVDNHALYWIGRRKGIKYIKPFLDPRPYSIEEDRRYQRIFWSPEFINLTPSCRHATHFMLSAY